MSNKSCATILFAASLTVAAACVGTPEIPSEVQAISDYVEVGELEEVDRVQTRGKDSWSPATEYYVLYKARGGSFLLAFARACRELSENTKVTPDFRYDHNVMRRGTDTLRGCRIDKIYRLTEAQALEIEALAKPIGAGN